MQLPLTLIILLFYLVPTLLAADAIYTKELGSGKSIVLSKTVEKRFQKGQKLADGSEVPEGSLYVSCYRMYLRADEQKLIWAKEIPSAFVATGVKEPDDAGKVKVLHVQDVVLQNSKLWILYLQGQESGSLRLDIVKDIGQPKTAVSIFLGKYGETGDIFRFPTDVKLSVGNELTVFCASSVLDAIIVKVKESDGQFVRKIWGLRYRDESRGEREEWENIKPEEENK